MLIGIDLSGLADGTLTLSCTMTLNDLTSEPETDTIEKVGESGTEISQGFSPNGDNQNDTWIIEGIDDKTDNTVTIFNRYGTIVWETAAYHNSNNAWDGSSNASGVNSSSGLPDGTYFYVLEYRYVTNNGEMIKDKMSGFILIER